ncbi:MAG: dTDP-4-dehydrorhamnose 3,5-epimerase, partial [Cyclobacteriaceae bacterium]|nr:dTDP-4-dehydrorhamnose 3,5-epimerase [Cyclobacteriaceae bacterium]
LWSDPELNISWKVDQPILSEKDQEWPTLADFVLQSGGGL